jgi:hypothetical protein
MKPTPDLHLKPINPLSEGWGPPLIYVPDEIKIKQYALIVIKTYTNYVSSF